MLYFCCFFMTQIFHPLGWPETSALVVEGREGSDQISQTVWWFWLKCYTFHEVSPHLRFLIIRCISSSLISGFSIFLYVLDLREAKMADKFNILGSKGWIEKFCFFSKARYKLTIPKNEWENCLFCCLKIFLK